MCSYFVDRWSDIHTDEWIFKDRQIDKKDTYLVRYTDTEEGGLRNTE